MSATHTLNTAMTAGGSTPTASRPLLTEEEIRAIRKGRPDGTKGILPARCYYDEEIYQFEVEHVLKKHWLYVGAWDWAENPGDYFTLTMFGEPLVIVRGKQGDLYCLVNVCRHRWSQVIDNGKGNVKHFMCPYHRWTYNLDGTLRGVSCDQIPGMNKDEYGLRNVRVEEWNGLVFINFDPNATPLAEEMEGMDEILKPYGLEKFRSAGITTYESAWNHKFSFETGYEAYHHAGIHAERIGDIMPPKSHKPIAFGKTWGAYAYTTPERFRSNTDWRFPYGEPPWMSEERKADPSHDAIFLGIYPNFISFIQPQQISAISVQHQSVGKNISSTTIAVAPWARKHPKADEKIAHDVDTMKGVQNEDTYACLMLQSGVRSQFNERGIMHPVFEVQMSHYYNWYLDHFLGEYDYYK